MLPEAIQQATGSYFDRGETLEKDYIFRCRIIMLGV